MLRKLLPTLLLTLFQTQCDSTKEETLPSGKWIQGSDEQKVQIIERQFRGFDMAMVETGYRYQELYWGIQDENWDYANYQLEKIQKTIENGLERRPKRAQSAEAFLKKSIPLMKESIDSANKSKAMEGFFQFQQGCNTCHAMESVPYFKVGIPVKRNSPIGE